MDLEKKFLGCIVGLAVGDALGFPVEFMNRSQIIAEFGNQGVSDFISSPWTTPGLYSDDTQMTLATAEALIRSDPNNLDDVMLHTKKQFQIWANSPDNDRAPGQTCMDGIRNMVAGKHWFSSGDHYSKGCGAAMRVAPIGMLFCDDEEKLLEISRANAICTHAHPTGISSAIAAAAAVAYVLNDKQPHSLLEHLQCFLHRKRGVHEFVEHISYDPLDEQVDCLKLVEKNLKTPPQTAFDVLGGGWIGEEAVAGALYCFLRSTGDFTQTVLTAANACKTDEKASGFGRCDSDSIACIAGAISGAYNGIDAIPEKWISQIENKDLLFDTAQKLYEKYQALKSL